MPAYSSFKAENLGRVDPNQGIIIDVRTKMEHAEKHIGFSHVHVPLDVLNPTDLMMRHGLDHEAEIYILCRSGKRAAQAADKFIAEGYRNVKVVEGGLTACENCGHEIKGQGSENQGKNSGKPRGPISLERQVRIGAGLLAATGAALGLWINPLFTLLPLFVGCGLIFAGVTDRCGLALVLTKAPWNQIEDAAPSASCGSKKMAGQSCR
ncbi:MAG: rhodanese-like domain-containing protein [Alphaproteobacteria bacterium]|nr:rhodanese-like domain-containing protein [Alphaproteobacteria bacterium]